MNTLKLISPTVLYPMTTIDSINPETLKRVTQEARNGGEIPTIKVLEFEKQLSIIGMNALYDIEALGGFTYNEYPAFYKKG